MSTESATRALDDYNDYLSKNYVGGCERFFSPVGFLDKFQKSVEVKTQSVRNHVFAKSVDDAMIKIEPVVAGGEGVFDLTAEPGTGKTSVLPFRFASKRVVVALPTPFDAWAAYQMATGDARLRLKGLSMGNSNARVTFTDSYLAAKALLSNYLEYDVLIVDECDSPRGVTKFLAEVKAPGKVLIRMSASHGRTQSGPSKSFKIHDDTSMPDVREGAEPLAEFVKRSHKGRSMVLMPDSDSAANLATMIPGSRLVCTRTKISDLARIMVSQHGDALFVADEVCARGLNLNLDSLFDTQLVSEFGVLRQLTPAEVYQRKGRVGRNRQGWYFSPGIPTRELKTNDADLIRHNVVRAFAGTPQLGEGRLVLTSQEADQLICTHQEPFVAIVAIRAKTLISAGNNDYASSSSRSHSRKSSSSTSSSKSSKSSRRSSVVAPSWLFSFTGGGLIGSSGVTGKTMADRFLIQRDGKDMYARKSIRRSVTDQSVTTSSRAKSLTDADGYFDKRIGHGSPRSMREHLPLVEQAPYAVSNRRTVGTYRPKVDLPLSPPVMDLTQLTYDLDWPSLIRDRLASGGDLPTLVPPGSWRHTSSVGIGTDWFKRLDDIAVGDALFSGAEFEVVSRAWNKLVAQSWVKKTPGLSDVSNLDRVEYCVRYFQSYFLLSSTE